jgi:signal transduction histidine kinase
MRRPPLSTAAVMGIQVLLGGLIWGLLAFAAASSAWLFDPQQIRFVMRFFRWQIPIIGGACAVVIPALQYDRLSNEVAESTEPEHNLIPRLLAFPRSVALIDFFGSLLLFTLAAVEMRLLARTAIEESVKIFLLGPVTGIIFGTLSYLVLGKATRPLLEEAVARGAFPTGRASISIASKIFLCCLALALVTLGLYGPIALGWSQRYVEEQAGMRSEEALAGIVKELGRQEPHDTEGWRSYLQSRLGGLDELVAVDRYDRLRGAASAPERESGFFKRMENREFLLLRGPGSFASRRDDNLVVSTALLPDGGRVYAASRPDYSAERRLLIESLRISLSVFLLALILAWAAGRAVAGPIVELKNVSRSFADDPAGAEIPMVVSDDETGSLSLAFSEMAHSVRTMRARLAQSERLAGAAESLAAVAHEIRNPLFGVTSTVAALQEELGSDPRYREHFEVVGRESQRLSRMIEEMLTLRGGLDIRRVPGDLESLLRSAAGWLTKRFPGRKVAVDLETAGEAVPVSMDSARLLQVFTNILENAVLASEDPAKLKIRLTFDRIEAVVEIEDAGKGIPPEFRERIFEPFFSLRDGGTGLGLSICRRIVSEHGGWIDADNLPSGGSLFRIHLPTGSSASV